MLQAIRADNVLGRLIKLRDLDTVTIQIKQNRFQGNCISLGERIKSTLGEPARFLVLTRNIVIYNVTQYARINHFSQIAPSS